MLYFQYENGIIALVKADPRQFTLVSTLKIEVTGKESRSHPAIANGRVYLRDRDKLHCFNIQAGGK